MRTALWLLLIFALAVALALAAAADQGYVIVVYPPWRLEMSFLLALALAFALFLLGYAAVRLLRVALRLPGEVKAWRDRRRRDSADRALHEAVAALLAGHHGEAVRQAELAATCSNPQLAALIGAEAARAGDQPEAFDRFLEAARGKAGEVEAARLALEGRRAGKDPAQAAADASWKAKASE